MKKWLLTSFDWLLPCRYGLGWVHWQTIYVCNWRNLGGLDIQLQIGNLIILSELDWSLRKCTLYVPLTDGETSSDQFWNKLPQHVLFRKNSRCGNLLKHFLASLILISRLPECSFNPWSCVLYKMYGPVCTQDEKYIIYMYIIFCILICIIGWLGIVTKPGYLILP